MRRQYQNPAFNQLFVANRAGIFNRRVRRFAGSDVAPGAGVSAAEGVTTAVERQSVAPSTINIGRRSSLNVETPLHANAVTLTLTNKGVTGTGAAAQADIILTAGDFASQFPNRVITDGTNAYTNDAGASVDVEVTCEYGVDGNTDTWENLKKWISRDGLAIAQTRVAWTLNAQRAKKLRFQRMDLFGDHVIDSIFPEVYYDKYAQDLKMIDTAIGYPLDAKTILKYSLVPNESVVFTFWVAGINEQTRILQDYLARRGGNMLG